MTGLNRLYALPAVIVLLAGSTVAGCAGADPDAIDKDLAGDEGESTSVAEDSIVATHEVGPGKPYATLQDVAWDLSPGNVVKVYGDHTYPGNVVLENSGTNAQKITILGVRVNGKRPKLSGGDNTLEIRANNYVIEGFDVTGGARRCIYHHGHNNKVRDTVVHDCPKQGILGGDYDTGSLTLEYVEVHHCGGGQYDHQIYMSNDQDAYPSSVFRMQHCYLHHGNGGNNVKSRASRNEIYYNWIEGAFYHELELIGESEQGAGLVREDSDVVGNVIKKQTNHFTVRVGGDGTADTNGRYRFVNNTFLLKAGSNAVFRLYDGIESIQMHNNIFYRVGGGGVKVMDTAEVSWTTGSAVIAGTKNWLASGSTSVPAQWTGTITGANPSFTDINTNNVQPAAGSLLINAGNNATASPPGYPFPAPLALPLYHPPQGTIEAVGTAAVRTTVGVVDIGARER